MTAVSFTDDQFLQGHVTLRQFAKGHRAGSDAVLLAATLPSDFSGLAVDAGSASGAVGVMAAWRAPNAHIRMVEIDPAEAKLATENIQTNALSDRVHIIQVDLFASHSDRASHGLCDGDADYVLSNPPYLDEGHVRQSNNDDRIRAHVMPEGGLEKWIVSCLHMLKPDGILTMIHRADQIATILDLMQGRFGELSILPIHAHENETATRILISGKRNSRAAPRILPGLVIHRDDGGFTPRAAAIHNGTADISLRPVL